MYSIVTNVHIVLFVLVFLLGLNLLVRAIRGLSSGGAFVDADRKAGLFFMISFVLLLLIGSCKDATPDLRDQDVSDEKQLLVRVYELQHHKILQVFEAFGDVAEPSSCMAHVARVTIVSPE